MVKIYINKIIERRFCTENNGNNKYSVELEKRFAEICKAELVTRVMEKRIKKDNLLLRSEVIVPEFIGTEFAVYNGRVYARLFVKKEMVGFKVGEFILTKKNKKYRKNSLSYIKVSKEERKRRRREHRKQILEKSSKTIQALNKLIS
jgi:ribosomal protein S19